MACRAAQQAPVPGPVDCFAEEISFLYHHGHCAQHFAVAQAADYGMCIGWAGSDFGVIFNSFLYYIHIHIQIHIHSFVSVYMHMYVQALAYMYIHTYIHTYPKHLMFGVLATSIVGEESLA